jgi:Uma2 family endonuclease
MDHTGGTSALKPDGRYTLAEWRSWPDGERWELVNGQAFAMSPAPRVRHQDCAFDLGRRLGNFLEGKLCKAYMAPLDVFLEEAASPTSGADAPDGSVVQPDVLVVCDPAKVREDGIHGAPDFVAEVLSDATANKDLGIKRELYERSGVREYWIIQPETATVLQYVRTESGFAPARELRRGVRADSAVFPGFGWVCP